MPFNPRKFSFSVDLKAQAVYQIDFLETVDKIQELKKPHVFARSVYRYEKYWLPLAASQPNECFSAPLDIEWVWHCHMLSPRAYSRDCVEIVNTVVNHTLRNKKDYQKALAKSRDLWYKLYQSEEPFTLELDSGAYYDQHAIDEFQSKITYNIIDASLRQKAFYYQVSLPHYRDPKYLKVGKLRYKQFLYLKQQLPDEFIVPCYDIDLIWHAHLLNPGAYRKDMMTYIGNLFNHDDTVTDRSEGSKLYNADKKTREHWKRIFKQDFAMFGAMYRGLPPEGFLYKVSNEDTYGYATKKTTVRLEEISLQYHDRRTLSKFKLNVLGGGGSKERTRLTKFKKPSGRVQGLSNIAWSRDEVAKNGTFVFDTRQYNNIMFHLEQSKGCCGSSERIGEYSYNILPTIENPSAKSGGLLDIEAPLSSDVQLRAVGQYTAPIIGPALLFLEQGQYETATIPENIQTLLGPVALERLPPGRDNHCQVASHRLKNHLGKVVFTCRTIHSAPLMQSVIQIWYQDTMAAIGHLIASDQLPLPTKVKEDVVTLNPRAGERAVLIKNNYGDWAIVTGKWTGFRRGVAGIPGTMYQRGRRGIPGSPGTLTVEFYKLNTRKWQRVRLRYLLESYTLSIESSKIDLMEGVVEIDTTSNEVAENLALAFSISLLHVLCVPRPSGWKEGQQVMPSVTIRGTRSVTRIPSDDMKFLMAVGLSCSTPSNFYIRSHYGIYACAMCGGEGEDGDCVTNFSHVCHGLEAGEDGAEGGAVYGGACGIGGGGCNDDGGLCGGCGGCEGCGGGGGGNDDWNRSSFGDDGAWGHGRDGWVLWCGEDCGCGG